MPNASVQPDFLVTEQEALELASMPVLDDVDPFKFFNPTAEVQEKFVGQSFGPTYAEGRDFVNYVIAHAIKGHPTQRLLDFGCGWGRMSRLLLRVQGLRQVEFHGCDISSMALDIVRRSVPGVWLAKCDATPPSIYRDRSLDVIIAYSVFSHLSEATAKAWGEEFARLLAPGGRVVITTQGRSILKVCEELRTGVREIHTVWHEKLSASFVEPDCLERYERGEFLFAATHPNQPSYGEAVVPKSWFEREWGAVGFEMVDWDETQTQNRFVMVLKGAG